MNRLPATAAALLLVSIGVGFWLYKREMPDDSVQVWVKGRGAGESIRLYPHGNFESSIWCDVCQGQEQHGTWTSTEPAIILHVASGPSITLSRIIFRGCTALTRKDEPPPRFPADVYFPLGDTCGDAL